jgi:hypothetical protein
MDGGTKAQHRLKKNKKIEGANGMSNLQKYIDYESL